MLIGKAQGGVGLQHVTKGTLEALPLPLPPLAEQHRIVAKVDELMALCDQLAASQVKLESRRDRLAAASFARLSEPDPKAFCNDACFALGALPSMTARPDQIQLLRKTILNLAVRGRLVRQNSRDQSASELLTQVDSAKGEARIKCVRFDGGSGLHAIPETWKWVVLDELISKGPQNGISPRPTTRHDAPMAITLSATTSGAFDPTRFKRVEADIPKMSEFWLQEGDLLFQRGNTREYVGIAAIYLGPPGTFLYPDLIMKVRVSNLVSLRFVHLAAISPPARAYFSANATGAQATMPKINQSTLVSLPIPIPPLAEQHRIVAMVDDLMAVCDRLEASLGSGNTTRSRLLDALLHEALQMGIEIAETG